MDRVEETRVDVSVARQSVAEDSALSQVAAPRDYYHTKLVGMTRQSHTLRLRIMVMCLSTMMFVLGSATLVLAIKVFAAKVTQELTFRIGPALLLVPAATYLGMLSLSPMDGRSIHFAALSLSGFAIAWGLLFFMVGVETVISCEAQHERKCATWAAAWLTITAVDCALRPSLLTARAWRRACWHPMLT